MSMQRDTKKDLMFFFLSILILLGAMGWQTYFVKKDPNLFYRQVQSIKGAPLNPFVGSIEGGRKYIYALADTKDNQLILKSKVKVLEVVSGGYLLRWDVSKMQDPAGVIRSYFYKDKTGPDTWPAIRSISSDDATHILVGDGWGQAFCSGYGFLPVVSAMGACMSLITCFYAARGRLYSLVVPIICLLLVALGNYANKAPTQASEIWAKSQSINVSATHREGANVNPYLP